MTYHIEVRIVPLIRDWSDGFGSVPMWVEMTDQHREPHLYSVEATQYDPKAGIEIPLIEQVFAFDEYEKAVKLYNVLKHMEDLTPRDLGSVVSFEAEEIRGPSRDPA